MSIKGTQLEDLHTFMISPDILRMENVSDTRCRDKTNILWSLTFFWKSLNLWDNVKNMEEPDRPQMMINMAYALCMLVN